MAIALTSTLATATTAPASGSTTAARPTVTTTRTTSLTASEQKNATATTRIDWDAVFYALHQVETSGRLGPILGDGGAALGPLQIHKGYHLDSGVDGPYSNCSSLAFSKRVVRGYMARYATERRLGRPVTVQDIARIHNGGPNGYKKRATLKYAEKFMRYYNDYSQH